MSHSDRPVVYLSYRWIDVERDGRPGRAADPRGEQIADRLRAQGFDVRLDVYFSQGLHGYEPPQRVPGDRRDPWLAWAQRQIAEADVVLMLCTPEYLLADPDRCEPGGDWHRWSLLDESTRVDTRVPALWWDWQAISAECDLRPAKFVPVGYGPYHADDVPPFVRGANYLNLEAPGAFDALARRIRKVWRTRAPRQGVFVSYAHADDEQWLQSLDEHLAFLRRDGVNVWTDRDIEVGALWHDAIASALDRAQVAVLMVSPAFLASSYIASDELPRMLDAAQGDGLVIFWIPVRASAYRQSPIARYQAAHNPDKPLAALRGAERDRAFVDIAQKLARALGRA